MSGDGNPILDFVISKLVAHEAGKSDEFSNSGRDKKFVGRVSMVLSQDFVEVEVNGKDGIVGVTLIGSGAQESNPTVENRKVVGRKNYKKKSK